jgi:hypothetical protein
VLNAFSHQPHGDHSRSFCHQDTCKARLSARIASALSLDTRGARWEEFSREKENYRQRSVPQQFNNGDFLERVGAVRD